MRLNYKKLFNNVWLDHVQDMDPCGLQALKRPLHRSPQLLPTRDASNRPQTNCPHIDIELLVPVVNFSYCELYV
jgi:hypothetical protein